MQQPSRGRRTGEEGGCSGWKARDGPAGSRLHVRLELPRSRRTPVGAHLDGPQDDPEVNRGLASKIGALAEYQGGNHETNDFAATGVGFAVLRSGQNSETDTSSRKIVCLMIPPLVFGQRPNL